MLQLAKLWVDLTVENPCILTFQVKEAHSLGYYMLETVKRKDFRWLYLDVESWTRMRKSVSKH